MLRAISTGALLLGLTACATADDGASEVSTAAAVAEDPRAFEEVSRICFASGINGFSTWDRGDGVVVRRGVSDQYLITTLPNCLPIDDALRIGVTERFGGGCVNRGDRLFVSSDLFGTPNSPAFDTDICRISGIYKWDEDALPDDVVAAGGEG